MSEDLIKDTADQETSEKESSGETTEKKKDASSGAWRRIAAPRWYAVHTYSGYENKVKANLEKLVENRGMQDVVLQIVVPTETVVEQREKGNRTRERKIFPGYVLVKMLVTDDSWYLVRNAQGVTGFVGQGSEPIPLSDEEIRRLGIEKTTIELNIKVGDIVKIIGGPFKGWEGVVEDVVAEKKILKTRVDMFGRSTPVELEFDQVDKLS